MAELDDEIYGRITELSDEGNELAEDDNFEAAVAKFSEALELLPAPKTDWKAATWLYASIGDMYYSLEKYEAAVNSLFDALNCPDGYGNPFVHLRLGESLCESGQTERAKEHLLQAYMLEGEDIFEDENPKYLNMIKM
jgi:tetratricopeptide (TPR) repeat protein